VLLEKINIPADLKRLSNEELPQLCEELRAFVRNTTKTKEGHINASLGVTELSVALHYVLHTPQDILVWDVGHQAYIHKVLTGRKSTFYTNRQKGGISGFTRRAESDYDAFGAGHSSTSISAVAGFAEADLLKGIVRNRVAVIGDGALTGGMSFEALNYIGEKGLDVLVVLNDNHQSIDENRGALQQLESYQAYFESLGFYYTEEVDGKNVAEAVESLKTVLGKKGPKCIRVHTSKRSDKQEPDKKDQKKEVDTFQKVAGLTLAECASQKKELVLISPAMLSGGGFADFAHQFPDRTYDVGIAEQHAVTMAAGMAAGGAVPVVHLYSTFAQRAYDQIIHDAVLQRLHIVFCLDRAGLVGEDGPTHHGTFDVGFLNTIPDVKILAPMNGLELEAMLTYVVNNHGAWFIRYPKAQTTYAPGGSDFVLRPNLLKEGREKLVFSFGAIGEEVKRAVEDTPYTHVDLRILKPFPQSFIDKHIDGYDTIITVEENSPRGGVGDSLRFYLSQSGFSKKVVSFSLPDQFIQHASREELLKDCGLDSESLRESFLLA